MKVSLHSIFSKLQTKILTEHNCYAADNIPFSDTHKIGISYEGFPIFFIASSNISSLSNIKLDLISIQFNQLCRLKLSNTDKPIENYYTIVALQTENVDYINYFIDVVEIVLSKLGNYPTQNNCMMKYKNWLIYFDALIYLHKNNSRLMGGVVCYIYSQ